MPWNRPARPLARPPVASPSLPRAQAPADVTDAAVDLDLPTYLRRGLSIPGMTKPGRRWMVRRAIPS